MGPGRPGERHLRPGRDPVRDPDGPGALPGPDGRARSWRRSSGASSRHRGRSSRRAAGAGGGLPQGDGAVAGGPVPTALDLAADVRRWLADEPVSAFREGLLTRILRWMRRHPAAVPLASFLCLCDGIILFTLLSSLIDSNSFPFLAFGVPVIVLVPSIGVGLQGGAIVGGTIGSVLGVIRYGIKGGLRRGGSGLKIGAASGAGLGAILGGILACSWRSTSAFPDFGAAEDGVRQQRPWPSPLRAERRAGARRLAAHPGRGTEPPPTRDDPSVVPLEEPAPSGDLHAP